MNYKGMKRFLFALNFAILSMSLNSKDIIFTDKTKEIKIGKDVYIYEDKTGKLEFEDIVKKDNSEFKISKRKAFNSGYTHSNFWFKGYIKNESGNTKFLIGGLEDAVEVTDLYYSVNNSSFIKRGLYEKDGMKIGFSEVYPCFVMDLKKGDSSAFYLKATGNGSLIRTILCIFEMDTYSKHIKTVYSFNLVDKFSTILLIIFTLYLLITFKSKLYFYCFAYNLLSFVLLATVNYLPFSNADLYLLILKAITRIFLIYYLLKIFQAMLNLKKVKIFNYCSWMLIFGMSIIYLFRIFDIIDFSIFLLIRNLIYLFLGVFLITVSMFWSKRNYIAKYLAATILLNFSFDFLLNFEALFKIGIFPVSIAQMGAFLTSTADIILFLGVFIFVKSDELKKQKSIIESSNNLARALSFAPDTGKVLASLLTTFRKNVNYDKGYVYLFKDGKYELTASTLDSVDPEESATLIEFLGKEIWTSADIIDATSEDKRFTDRKIDKIESILVLPIKYNGEYYGAILITSHYKYMFTYESINYGVDLVQKTAIVLDSFNKVKTMNELLNLAEVEKLSRRLLESTNHELKSPVLATLFFIQKAIGSLKKFDKEGKFDEEWKEELTETIENLEVVEESAQDALKSIEEAMALAGGETDKVFAMLELNNIIEKFAKTSKEYYDIDTKLYLNASGWRVLQGPKIGLKNAISSMIKNAIEAFDKFDMQGRSKEVKIMTDIRDGKLYIEICDNGKGIKKENQKKVFGLFSEGKPTGSGKGLMFAKVVMDRLGSEIHLESEEGKFTRFYFTIDVLKKDLEEELGITPKIR